MSSARPSRLKPGWLKISPPGGENYVKLKGLLRGLSLHTVCEEAACPNVSECWGGGTATFMLMGDICTRGCKFCHVKSGNPNGVLDIDEPIKVAEAISKLNLKYVVLTSVDRDDLPDGGADHFARTVEAIKSFSSTNSTIKDLSHHDTLVEVLVPDFRGNSSSIERIARCGADVIGHNIETVERLTSKVRDVRATYKQSLEVLGQWKKLGQRYTKSSIMVGLGETEDEVIRTMDDLRSVGVDILTIGQYLRPTSWHLPVIEYLHPSVFKRYEEIGLQKGFLFVPSGPLVRSSYRAGEKFIEAMIRTEQGVTLSKEKSHANGRTCEA